MLVEDYVAVSDCRVQSPLGSVYESWSQCGSHQGAALYAGKFRLTPENIYLLHDELDKSLGKVTLKLGGSARGHNGVRSCIDHLKSDTMIRLLIGIGRPADKSSVTPYVLARFTKNKQETLTLVLEKGLDLLLGHIQKRTQAATSTPITRPVQNRI
ncbi:peptidyl-tRNA hydrolase-like isoform X2 [Dendrobates tinctorius]|uniref:peptidyl-tRNA hydrolase-like isoform X2 n=1 Tax=Dendrobates tinctorius TaxID=92724 RepID=UPI003CC98C25